MEISTEQLREVLTEAYNRGWKGSLDLCDSVVDEISERFKVVNPKKEKEQLLLFRTEPTENYSYTISVDGINMSSFSISGGGEMQ